MQEQQIKAPQQQSSHNSPVQHTPKKNNLLIGVTGSVATIKLPQLLSQLLPFFNIKVIVTKHVHHITIVQAMHFINSQQYQVQLNKFRKSERKQILTNKQQYKHNKQGQDIKCNQVDIESVEMLTDQMQWQMWTKRGDPVLHIQLRKWADIFLIAPLSAHTLAKLSTGQCDNLLTLVCRAWPIKSKTQQQKPIIVCPSMNTYMWEHPITSEQISKLQEWGYEVVGPVPKRMMCGDFGNGALAEVKDIVQYVKNKIDHRYKMGMQVGNVSKE